MSYAEPCAEYAGMDYDVLNACYSSVAGDEANKFMAEQTSAFAFEYNAAWQVEPLVEYI